MCIMKKEVGTCHLGYGHTMEVAENYVPLIGLPSGKADDVIVAQPLEC